MTKQQPCEPDSVLRPAGAILSEQELRVGLAMPVTQYSMMENALRAAEGRSIEQHRREVASLWARMSELAAENPHAWIREPVPPDFIAYESERNPMLAFPYTRLHTSQWNVDQAAGLILCSKAAADAVGIAPDRRVYPWAVTESNVMVPVSERLHPHRCPGYERAAEAIRLHTGRSVAEADYLELYSCFPVAVRIQGREMGIDETVRPVSLTGGMTFAGGPLNNFVFQALVPMVEMLRADPGATGVVTAVSGMLTKQGVTLWSAGPPPTGFRFADVSEQVARELESVPVVAEASGHARVVCYTVLFDETESVRTVLLCNIGDRRRVLLSSEDTDLAAEATTRELCGKKVRLDGCRVELL